MLDDILWVYLICGTYCLAVLSTMAVIGLIIVT